jgi:hypothetical protein
MMRGIVCLESRDMLKVVTEVGLLGRGMRLSARYRVLP